MSKQRHLQTQKHESAAYHEAGHVVIGWCMGLMPENISISEDNVSVEAHRLPLPRKTCEFMGSYNNVGHMQSVVRIFLAGGIAQRRFDPRGSGECHGAPDYERAVEILSRFVSTDRERDAYINLLMVQTEQLLDTWWPQVEVLAKALLERSKFSCEEAWVLIEQSIPIPGPRSD